MEGEGERKEGEREREKRVVSLAKLADQIINFLHQFCSVTNLNMGCGNEALFSSMCQLADASLYAKLCTTEWCCTHTILWCGQWNVQEC